MRRRELLKYAGATALAGSFGYRAKADLPTVKVGVVGAKTGPLAPGAAITHFPPYQLWAHEVNDRGGLKLKDGQRKIELIEYDDRTQPPEAIKAVERLATVDKADWIGGVYATGFNLATAPTFAKYGYPQLTQACVTDQGPALVKRYPGFFMFQSSTTAYAKGAIGVLKNLKDSGQIGNKVAAVNVGDDFGIELANAGRPLFKEAGFEIVYDKSYPLGTQDYTPVIKAANDAKPDAFVAWSYPPDTFGLADAAKIEGLSVKAYYCAVGCAFQGFSQKNGAAAENILGAGGVTDSPEIRDFYKRHKDVTKVDADYWGSPFYYSMLQMLTESIEAVGSMDRMAIAAHFRNRKFKTLIGEVELPGQILNKVYTVGQWQSGFFSAVAGEGFSNYSQVKLKTSWG
jgi:branched-chain amino acid transport system substrate-binding protein